MTRWFTTKVVSYLVVVFLGAAAGAGTVTLLGELSPSYTSSASFTVRGVDGNGADPDRFVATQLGIIQSRSLAAEVRQQLTSTEPVVITARQSRLSDIVVLSVESPDPSTATVAVSVAVDVYTQRAAAQAPAVVVQVIDDASLAARTADVVKDAAVAGIAGAGLAAAALLTATTARPRVRRASARHLSGAAVLELPDARWGGAERSEPSAKALRRLALHLTPSAGDKHFTVHPLPQVSPGMTAWVERTLRELVEPEVGEHFGTVSVQHEPIPQSTDRRGRVAVVLSKEWLDSEQRLVREVAARQAFGEVMVVLVGGARPFLLPPSATSPLFRSSEDGDRRRGRRFPEGA